MGIFRWNHADVWSLIPTSASTDNLSKNDQKKSKTVKLSVTGKAIWSKERALKMNRHWWRWQNAPLALRSFLSFQTITPIPVYRDFKRSSMTTVRITSNLSPLTTAVSSPSSLKLSAPTSTTRTHTRHRNVEPTRMPTA